VKRLALTGTVLVLASGGCVPWSIEPSLADKLDAVEREYGGRVFFVGRSFADLPLTDILYGPETGASTVTFVYGDCEVDPGIDPGGCPLPLDIQNAVCPGRRTAVGIFGTDASVMRRAARSLRPLGGGRARAPAVVLDRGPVC
jgi:hypothetical protein